MVVDKGRGEGRLCVHVRAMSKALQGRQGASLLERGGELPSPRRSGDSAPGVEVVREGSGAKPMALFAEDREVPELACETVRVKVGELAVRRPRRRVLAGA